MQALVACSLILAVKAFTIAIPKIQQVIWLAIAIVLHADIVKVVKEYPYVLAFYPPQHYHIRKLMEM